TREIQDQLDTAVRELGATTEGTHRWAGTMGFTESGLPMAGPLEGRQNGYLCAGFTGHGVGFAFMTAKQVAESVSARAGARASRASGRSHLRRAIAAMYSTHHRPVSASSTTPTSVTTAR